MCACVRSDPNKTSYVTASPLSWACKHGCVELVQLLLAAGADPEDGGYTGGEVCKYTAPGNKEWASNEECLKLIAEAIETKACNRPASG